MKVTAERIDNHKLVLQIEVPQPEVAKAVQRAYQKLAAQVNIPGFRKGKAPRKVLEMRIGKEAILDEAFEILAPQAYSKALDEQQADPVTRPEIEVITLAEDQPLTFKATVTVKPEIQLGEYKGLSVVQPSAEVTEEAINAQLDSMRNREAKMVVMEDAELTNGDFAIIDFEGFVDGKPFQGGDAKGYPLEVGSGSFIPGFEDQLLGAKAGDERTVNVTFPTEYFVPELAGKDAEFKVKIHDIKRKELPELDDDFAKDVSEFNSLEELKADVKNKLEQAAAEKAEREFRNNAVKAAVDNSTVDIPEVMTTQRVAQMIQDLQMNLEGRGMKFEDYLKYTGTDVGQLKESYREAAQLNVKTDLLLDAVAKAESIQAAPEDMENEVAAMAQNFGANPKDVWEIIRKEGRLMGLIESVVRKKSAQFIIDNAVKA